MPSYPKGCRIPPRQEQQISGRKHVINTHLPPKGQKCRLTPIYRPPYDAPLSFQRETVYTSTCENKNSTDPRSYNCEPSKCLDTQTSTNISSKAEPQLLLREYFVDPSSSLFKSVFPRAQNRQYDKHHSNEQSCYQKHAQNLLLLGQDRLCQRQNTYDENSENSTVSHCTQRRWSNQQSPQNYKKNFYQEHVNHQRQHCKEPPEHQILKQFCKECQKIHPCPIQNLIANEQHVNRNTCHKQECPAYHPSHKSCQQQHLQKEKPIPKTLYGVQTQTNLEENVNCKCSKTQKAKNKNKVECSCETGTIPRFKDEPLYRSEGVECLPTKDATTCPKKSVTLCDNRYPVIDFGHSACPVCSRTSITSLYANIESCYQSTKSSAPIPSCECSTSCCLIGEEKSKLKKLNMGVGSCCQAIETATSTVCSQEPNIPCCQQEEFEPCSTCSQAIGKCAMENSRNDWNVYSPCQPAKRAICESKSASSLHHHRRNKMSMKTMDSISMCDLQKIIRNDCCTEDQASKQKDNGTKKKGKVICACSDKTCDSCTSCVSDSSKKNKKKGKVICACSDKTCDSCTNCVSDSSKKKKKKGKVICACSDKTCESCTSCVSDNQKKKGKASACACSDKTCNSCASCVSDNSKKYDKKKKGKASACSCSDKTCNSCTSCISDNSKKKKGKASACSCSDKTCNSCTSCVPNNSEKEEKKRQKSKKTVSYSCFSCNSSNSKRKMNDTGVSPRTSTTKIITKCPNDRKMKEVYRNPYCVSTSKSLTDCSSSNCNRKMKHAGVSSYSPRMSTTNIITKCPNARKNEVFRNPSCMSTSKSLTLNPRSSKISLSCKGLPTTACDNCTHLANSLRREHKRTIESVSFASRRCSPLSIFNSSVSCCSYAVEIPKTTTDSQKIKNTRVCKELVYILTEIQHGSKSNSRKMEKKKKVKEENESLIKDAKSMKKTDSKRATVKTESTKSLKKKEFKESKDTKKKESKESKDTKNKESKDSKDLKKKISMSSEDELKKDKNGKKSKDAEVEAKASKVECQCKSPVCGKTEKSTMAPSSLALEKTEPQKCECCFPPAFSHFSCTGTLFGNCTCSKR